MNCQTELRARKSRGRFFSNWGEAGSTDSDWKVHAMQKIVPIKNCDNLGIECKNQKTNAAAAQQQHAQATGRTQQQHQLWFKKAYVLLSNAYFTFLPLGRPMSRPSIPPLVARAAQTSWEFMATPTRAAAIQRAFLSRLHLITPLWPFLSLFIHGYLSELKLPNISYVCTPF